MNVVWNFPQTILESMVMHAAIAERVIQVTLRYTENPNTTANPLCCLTGVTYMNTVFAAANTLDFLQFFEEAIITHWTL